MEKTPKVRLSEEEIRKIKDIVHSVDSNAEVILFGSRTDLKKKGGDIDLLVVSSKITYRDRRRMRALFFREFGDRKVDLIVTDNPSSSAFTEIAYKYGVKL